MAFSLIITSVLYMIGIIPKYESISDKAPYIWKERYDKAVKLKRHNSNLNSDNKQYELK